MSDADNLELSRPDSAKSTWTDIGPSDEDNKDELVMPYDTADTISMSGKEAPAPYEGEEAPVAMESETYDSRGQVKVAHKHGDGVGNMGCWFKFKRGIRAIWQTKQTEDTTFDRELYIKTTLRELIIYVIFLTLLCLITFGMTSTSMFYFTKVMSELFLEDGENPLAEVRSMENIWEYMDKVLIAGLYWETWYDGKPVTEDNQKLFIFFENKLLGLPRIRQVKVRDDSCEVPGAFKSANISSCYGSFSSGNEDARPFGPANSSAWIWQENVDGVSASGLISSYSSTGYYIELPGSAAEARNEIAALKANRWIDRGTRAVIVDFTVYNANINLFCVVKLMFELPLTGGVIPTSAFRTVKLIRYVSTFDYIILGCEAIFCLFIFYYIVEESIEISKHRCSYFYNFWNLLDVIVIFIALACIGFTVYRTIMTEQKLDELLGNPEKYANFEFLSFAQNLFNDAIAIMVFVAWIKIFKYISFNKTMNQLSSTLSRCAKDVGGFAVMFFIFFFAYAQLGYLIFGTQVKDFSTFYDAIFTLLRTILGDFNFREMEAANRVLGPIFFLTYIFFVFFILLNMFLAIINDTYAEVKAELATQKNEFELGDYFKRSYYNMLRKMNLKKDRIVDIQAVLHPDGSNQHREVSYDEWREQLKKRGYAEQEIEAMFARYDLDADRALDPEEARNLELDLKGTGLGEDDPGQLMSARSRFGEADDNDGGLGGGSGGAIAMEEFTIMTRRVDRIEHSITTVVTKIDAAIHKLSSLDKMKMKHRERMMNIMHEIAQGGSDEHGKRKQLEKAVGEELDRFEQDNAIED